MSINTKCVFIQDSIVKPAAQSRTARLSTLMLLSGLLSYAQVAAPVVVGYYMESSAFPLSTLVTNGSVGRLTHLNYAFADIKDTQIDTNTHQYSCALHDPAGETGTAGVFQQLKSLKAANSKLKILISLGGALGSGNYANAADDAHREAFVQSCVNLFIDGQFSSPSSPGLFDGIDVDWEFPQKQSNGDPNVEYSALMQSFRTHLDTYKQTHAAVQQPLLLTSAINPNNGGDWQLQDINFLTATRYVDFYNVMTYDNSGAWNDSTASTGPLSWIQNIIPALASQGIPMNKIVLGVPFYGIHYSGNFGGDTTSTGLSTLLSQSATAPVQTAGDAYNPPGTQTTDYASIVQQTLTKPNVTIAHDSYGTAWAFDVANSILWAYDDEATIKQKGDWARLNGLLGLMTWEIGKDTANGALLCAMESAANGTSGVCSASSAPVGPVQPPPPTMLFDFEAGVDGWRELAAYSMC